MQKVLIPFDGSAPAKRAVQYLASAAATNASLEVHVLNVSAPVTPYGDYVPNAVLEHMRQDALAQAAKVNEQATDMLKACGVRCTAHEVSGEVIPAIAKAVETLGVDTVVMGTRGMSNFANLMMGSVASRVVHEVSVPVLLVK